MGCITPAAKPYITTAPNDITEGEAESLLNDELQGQTYCYVMTFQAYAPLVISLSQ